MFLYLHGTAQINKTDTTVINVCSKIITHYEKNRIIEISIFGKDTFRFVDNSLYYKNYMDSLKTTSDYVRRDTISLNPDFLFIRINFRGGGCFNYSQSDMFFYYNSKLKSTQKSIMFFINHVSKKYSFSYINVERFHSIINILNTNMAFNIRGMGKVVLPDQQFYTTSWSDIKIEIIAKEKNHLLENKFSVDKNYFGFGWNIYSTLHKIELEKVVNNDTKNIQEFFEMNKSVLNENEYAQEMVGIFKGNEYESLK